jgi:hypothetical protein
MRLGTTTSVEGFAMKDVRIRSAFALALLAATFGLSACHDERPDRDDRRPHGDHSMGDHPMDDHDHHDHN